MTSRILATLRRVVVSEIEHGTVIQVESYLRVFSSINTKLTRRDIERVIIQALHDTGGRANWKHPTANASH